MADAEEYLSFEQDVSDLADILFSASTVAGTLALIVGVASETVDGCDTAAVLTIDDNDTAQTVASSSPLAETLDDLQIAFHEGPCLDAARTGTTFYDADLTEGDRWPQFASAAVDAGVRSVLAYSLSARRMSALNLYAYLPAAFGATDRAKGQLFASLARHALEAAEGQAAEEVKTVGLTQALHTRELIGQAQGILMEREKITADRAFALLRRASQHLNVKLRDVAATLVETGESPDSGPEQRRI